jgi:hypothetical protein
MVLFLKPEFNVSKFCKKFVIIIILKQWERLKMLWPSTFLVGQSKGKRLLGRPRCKWSDNIKMGLKINNMGVCGLD